MEIKYYIRDYINKLNDATKAYDEGKPYMSDAEWDKMYYDLEAMEKDSGIIYPDSPTQSIQFNSVSKLNKVAHSHPMISLAKTKSNAEAEAFIRKCTGAIIMGKMDGLTCSIRYENGKLVSAETRGNGEVGEDITHNILMVHNVPKKINHKGTLVVDGEVICTFSNFKKFKESYKNPRNFAAGSIRLFDSSECVKRQLSFIVWDCIEGFDDSVTTLSSKLECLMDYGFETVPWCCPSADDSFQSCIDFLKKECYDYPIDGIVIKENDCARYSSASSTAHHPNAALAFKFYDEEYQSSLVDIEWTMGRTGVLTPVAVFEPVEIEGAVIERANLHNINIMRETLGDRPHYGQIVNVYRANMIIPQLVNCEISNREDLRYRIINGKELNKPEKCPICGAFTRVIESDGGTLNLICENLQCEGRFINRLDHYAGKKGLDIKGLSKATLEKLIDWGWLNKISDIYNLYKHRNEWILKPGFGPKSVDNILSAIESSKNCELHSFISALGIPLIGSTYAKEMCKYKIDYFSIREDIKKHFDFTKWNGFGYEMCKALWNFDYAEADKLADDILNIKNSLHVDNKITIGINKNLNGKSVVITGKLNLYKNRAELQNAIEAAGGKVINSISKNTFVLINNDTESTSSKNLSAKRLGIPIVSEKEFQDKFLDF